MEAVVVTIRTIRPGGRTRSLQTFAEFALVCWEFVVLAVTWLDDTGCSLVTWVAREQRLAGLVLPQHLEVRTSLNYGVFTDPFLQDVLEKWTGFQKIKCIIYPTLSDAIRLAVD